MTNSEARKRRLSNRVDQGPRQPHREGRAGMSDTERDQVNAVARALMAEWERAFVATFADMGRAILASDWLATHEAQVRADERREWADWIETWQESVTPEPITVDVIRDWLRADRRPFGIFRAGDES